MIYNLFALLMGGGSALSISLVSSCMLLDTRSIVQTSFV